MRTIYAEYNINHDSIDVYTSAGYMLRIDCWKAEKNLKTTYGSECALTSLAVLWNFLSLIFSHIKVHENQCENITQGKE